MKSDFWIINQICKTTPKMKSENKKKNIYTRKVTEYREIHFHKFSEKIIKEKCDRCDDYFKISKKKVSFSDFCDL